MDGRNILQVSKTTDGQKRVTKWTPQEWTGRQGRPTTRWRDNLRPYPPPGSCVAKNSPRLASVETVQGGVPPYGVKETLVVNSNCKSRRSA